MYQGLIDSKLLPPGIMDFNLLNDVFIIIITPFDPFGKGYYRYTFKNHCLESPDLYLEDGATRIFLNTHGKNEDEVSPELVEMLHFMEHTNDLEISDNNEKLQQFRNNVKLIQENAEVGVRYMQAWEEIEYAKLEGKAEGMAQEREQARLAMTASIRSLMARLDKSAEEAMELLDLPKDERKIYLERLR